MKIFFTTKSTKFYSSCSRQLLLHRLKRLLLVLYLLRPYSRSCLRGYSLI